MNVNLKQLKNVLKLNIRLMWRVKVKKQQQTSTVMKKIIIYQLQHHLHLLAKMKMRKIKKMKMHQICSLHINSNEENNNTSNLTLATPPSEDNEEDRKV